jgi:hypothetical protein
MKNDLNLAQFGDSLEAFIQRCLETSGAMPSTELCVFSGKAEDWQKDGNAVYLRLTASRLQDRDGNPHEVWARLFAPAGLWVIPRAETEMVVLVAPHSGGTPAAGWCMHSAQTPPAKLDQEKAYLVLDDVVKWLISCGGFAIKGATGTVVGVDRDTGKFQVSLANGSYLAFNPTGPAFEVVIGDGLTPNHVLAALKISPTGIEMVQANALGTEKQVFSLVGGAIKSVGTGACQLGYKGGCIVGGGNTTALPVLVGPLPGVLSTKLAVAM